MNPREIFLRHLAQTSPAPLAIEIVHAEGCILTDASGKNYIDLIGGISVANTGHRHPAVLESIRAQLDRYLHVMVYGEFIEGPQVEYAKMLTANLPGTLNSVYFTNSGAEAVEGAMKLAKRFTGRTGIIAFRNSYHGSTQGALSIIGDEEWRNAYRPLLPGILHLDYNSQEAMDAIDNSIACVIVEPVQAEAGVIAPDTSWLRAIREKCSATGALLVYDEIQTGFGRTGKLWGFQQSGTVPDILLLGKAVGGGMPLGAFIADRGIMNTLTFSPILGHITTFGGHPVSCAAGVAAMKVLLEENLMEKVEEKKDLLLSLLVHPLIKKVNATGLWMAVEFESFDICKQVVDACIGKGVLTDWFLFAPNCLRISPPLVISADQIREVARVIVGVCGEVQKAERL